MLSVRADSGQATHPARFFARRPALRVATGV
jgi:hypothetical protein